MDLGFPMDHILTLLLSVGSYYLIETQFQKLKGRFA